MTCELNLEKSDTIPLRKLSQRFSDNSLQRQKCHKIKLIKEEYDAHLQRLLHCVYNQGDTCIFRID